MLDEQRCLRIDNITFIFHNDAAARFKGEVPEPREGVESGHIPGSLNLPFNALVQANDVTRCRAYVCLVYPSVSMLEAILKMFFIC